MAETELFDFGAAAREAVQRAVDEIIPKLSEQLAKDINVPSKTKGVKAMKKEYIIRDEAMTIPVLPKEQRLQFRNADEAFEEGWRQALECLAFLPAEKVIDLDDALSEVVFIHSPFGKDGSGDAISRTVVINKLTKLAGREEFGVAIKGMTMPITCCYCPLMFYDAYIEWKDNGRDTVGAYCCKLTRELINNTKREDHCPLVQLHEPPKEET